MCRLVLAASLLFLPGNTRGASDAQRDAGTKTPDGKSNSAIVRADFNGDGFGDLAVGVPGEDIESVDARGAGGVNVIYGSPDGLVAPLGSGGPIPQSQFWSQSTPGIPGWSESSDHFGFALAAGDFNADGFSDLAIGVPGEDINTGSADLDNDSGVDSGGVVLIYGSSAGLTITDPAVPGPRFMDLKEIGTIHLLENLGASLAVGDFNRDGVDDLAAGAPGTGVHFIAGDEGSVWIFHGARAAGTNRGGLTLTGRQFITAEDTRLKDAQFFERFGETLTAADFDGDGRTDLAVGAPERTYEDRFVDGVEIVSLFKGQNAGAVAVVYGGRTRLGSRSQVLDPFTFDGPYDRLHFGDRMTAGDFNGDGRADLAVGVPAFDLDFHGELLRGAGTVAVYYGTADGLEVGQDSPQMWLQEDLFAAGDSEAGDSFGSSLAAGDFNGDGRADLAVGVPFESLRVNRNGAMVNIPQAGEVDVIYGSAAGLTPTGAQRWHQDSAGIQGAAEERDWFGYDLTALNLGRNRLFGGKVGPLLFTADLVIGIPLKDLLYKTVVPDPSSSGLGSMSPTLPPLKIGDDSGAVLVIYGSSAGGLGDAANQVWSQASPGVPGDPDDSDRFGTSF
jgi:hypothetical protein